MSGGANTFFDVEALTDFENEAPSSLDSILKSSRQNTAPTVDLTQPSKPTPSKAKSARTPRPAKDPAGRGTAAKKSAGERGSKDAAPVVPGRVRSTTIHLPATVRRMVKEETHATGKPNAAVLLDSIVWCHNEYELSDLVAEGTTLTGGDLFAPRASRERPIDDELAPLNVRFRESDYPVIDRLVEQSGASSRSHLFTVTTRAYLEGHQRLSR